ncbi:phosphatidate phosphatase PAH1-like [Arachis stenosperma]|uniref:phosphatidate phosphatase PAH1-like n=1 Tax=Arachis stenosperma TaxID=217475 RepID=UPI0025ACE45C|nr:phosphatidate phosphatase PAH1-like [Arachis stenosperma]XP_057722493.1 phosphatidate phosphatase PAH1-like [Arachis stenosperma]XP_057722494.1 phosphatidate phosphatase PAH1-like [Arachis stenosperma]
MNVVGKVGSLITQGVYSVATPFHPFGGAVDVIVVQQQDGTFRSTPWYVRFGKFQGVLKGAEKFVRINVNGVEANFHMYLDNSGEAYFIKEVDDDKDIESSVADEDAGQSDFTHVHRLDHSISDSGVLRLKANDRPQIQRVESDLDRRYYELQDDEPGVDGSFELSEYGSNRYDNPNGENDLDSHGSHPEVVLVSVDGHMMTAPICGSEQNDEENVQLKNPQFHLGPAEGTEFCEGNEFTSDENAWAADYIRKLDDSTDDVPSCSYNRNGGDTTSEIVAKVHQREEVHVRYAEATLVIKDQENYVQSDTEEVASGLRRETVFKSCLALDQFGQQDENDDSEDEGSPAKVQKSADEYNANCSVGNENAQENIKSPCSIDELSPLSRPTYSDENGSTKVELGGVQEVDDKASVHVDTDSGSHSVTNDNETEGNDELIENSVLTDGVDDSKQIPALDDANNLSEEIEPQPTTSNDEDQSYYGLGFEISLCGHELKVGMGSVAAAETFDAHRISAEEFRASAPLIIKNENLVVKFRERYLLWEKAAPLILGMAVFGLDSPVNPDDTIPVEQGDALSRDGDAGSASSGRRWRLWPIPFRRVKTLEHSTSNASSDEIFVDTESELQSSLLDPSPKSYNPGSPHKQFVRTNVPGNEQIASLNLKEGQNLVTFSFSTRVLGTQQVDAHIYLWKWDAKIVISDVDGTITKSDVLGQFMPLVGKDWSQSGVARLFSAIKENGYQLLFLSARAIVQAYLTRNFLLNLKQDGNTLPNGPVVISPDGLFPSLYREVIRRAPHEFKIACLEDIKRLFPADYNPFYAGFGNRDTDELSYRKIGIPKGKIFIINPKGEVAISQRIDSKSYTSLHTLVNDMFPPTSLVEHEDFNSWNYWRVPIPDVNDN